MLQSATAKRAAGHNRPGAQPHGRHAGQFLVSKPNFQRAATEAERGRKLRDVSPRQKIGEWRPDKNRPDPVEQLIENNRGRDPKLVPIRYGRMMQSPFAFYRGAAAIMARDLSKTASTGVIVQACGDCHLANFGAFATAERRNIFDINDFDETAPAPWEWDVMRLAASFVVAGRNNRFSESEVRGLAQRCAQSYRVRTAEFADANVLDGWYARIDLEPLVAAIQSKQDQRRAQKRMERAINRSLIDEDYPSLVSMKNGRPHIRDNPPLISHLEDEHSKEFRATAHQALIDYRESLPDDKRVLFDRFEPIDFANKVVGVGSVGTRCGILLMMAGPKDPLFLQVKEANASVLEKYAGKSVYANHGQRVVTGQRIMQAASDIFLGWTKGRDGRQFYIRQLRDMKVKPLIEVYDSNFMAEYADMCGWALARAHARSGVAAVISGYLGSNEKFDEAVAGFAVAYADQNDADHAQLVQAVRAGRVEAYIEQ